MRGDARVSASNGGRLVGGTSTGRGNVRRIGLSRSTPGRLTFFGWLATGVMRSCGGNAANARAVAVARGRMGTPSGPAVVGSRLDSTPATATKPTSSSKKPNPTTRVTSLDGLGGAALGAARATFTGCRVTYAGQARAASYAARLCGSE